MKLLYPRMVWSTVWERLDTRTEDRRNQVDRELWLPLWVVGNDIRTWIEEAFDVVDAEAWRA